MVTLEEAAPYLLRRGLLEPSAFVDGEVRVEDHSRRNRNLKVHCSHGPNLLLKRGLDDGARATVAHEAVLYERFRSVPSLAPLVPPLHSYDGEAGILAVELIPDARTLRDHQLRSGRFPLAVAGSLGRTLATLHGVGREHLPANLAPSPGPWVLSVHRPGLDLFRDTSAAGIELVKTIQRFPDLGEQLDRLRDGASPTSLIHGDVRWDNCVVRPSPAHRVKGVKLVDWEAAGLGDPAWDVGCVVAEYLATWLWSLPLLTEAPDEQLLQLARYPLEKMQPAIRTLWRSYIGAFSDETDPAEERLVRTVRYGGARLIQIAFESVRFTPSVNGWVIYLLQLGLNILKRPHEAAVHLLSISP